MQIQKTLNEILVISAREPNMFYSPSEIKALYKKLTDEQKAELFNIIKNVPFKEEATILHKILVLCKQIVRYDVNFENKISETENAKRIANKIKEDYDKLVVLVEQVDPKDTDLVTEMLSMLNHPWMRVLGDQLKYHKDGNLEEKLENLKDHISLQKKKELKKLDNHLEKIKIPLPDKDIKEIREWANPMVRHKKTPLSFEQLRDITHDSIFRY